MGGVETKLFAKPVKNMGRLSSENGQERGSPPPPDILRFPPVSIGRRRSTENGTWFSTGGGGMAAEYLNKWKQDR